MTCNFPLANFTTTVSPSLTELVNRNANISNINSSCFVMPMPTNNFNSITWVTDIALPTIVPSGGSPIPLTEIIPPTSTSIPPNSVTIISGFCGSPTKLGAITLSNGFFTLPLSGPYMISGNVTFVQVSSTSTSDLREIYLYYVEHKTGMITLLAVSNVRPVAGSQTSLSVATTAYLNERGRIFMAVRQTNVLGQTLSTVPGAGRFSVTCIK